MSLMRKSSFAGMLGLLALAATGQAQVVVYNNLAGGTALAGYSEVNTNNPIFGDALNLTSGGKMSSFGFTVFNSGSGGNTGSILTANMELKFYDNTVPYAGGALSNPLIATVGFSIDFGTGLPAGFYTEVGVELGGLNIIVPTNIFVTQQLTETSGDSLRNGVVLFNLPNVGSSPNSVYLKSSGTAEGLYTFGGLNNNDFGYQVVLVPEPANLANLGIGALALLRRRRK